MAIIIKTPEQIAGIKKACQLAHQTLLHVEQFIKVGVSTEYINQMAEGFIRDNGAIPAPLGYHGFPKATCISVNEVICHGIPSDDTFLCLGDLVNVDVTTILDGYFGDTSITFAVGEISEQANRLMSVARDCLNIGVHQVAPKVEFWRIGKAISDYATSCGFSVVHQFAGHGTGLMFHEEPIIDHSYNGKNKDNRKMKAGMVFTIEPMINSGLAEAVIDPTDKWTARTVDGRLSAQFEHTVLVTDFGVEILTT